MQPTKLFRSTTEQRPGRDVKRRGSHLTITLKDKAIVRQLPDRVQPKPSQRTINRWEQQQTAHQQLLQDPEKQDIKQNMDKPGRTRSIRKYFIWIPNSAKRATDLFCKQMDTRVDDYQRQMSQFAPCHEQVIAWRDVAYAKVAEVKTKHVLCDTCRGP